MSMRAEEPHFSGLIMQRGDSEVITLSEVFFTFLFQKSLWLFAQKRSRTIRVVSLKSKCDHVILARMPIRGCTEELAFLGGKGIACIVGSFFSFLSLSIFFSDSPGCRNVRSLKEGNLSIYIYQLLRVLASLFPAIRRRDLLERR